MADIHQLWVAAILGVVEGLTEFYRSLPPGT